MIAVFKIYLYTMYPALKNGDAAEIIASGYTLGINHPPGYPLFSMMAKIFSYLPLGSPAFRIDLFTEFLALIVLFFSFYLIKQNIRFFFGCENKIVNFIGVFILAFSYIFWNQAIDAKGGIYLLNLLFLAIMVYLSIELFKAFNIKYLYLMSYIYGLSLSNHWPSMIILLPVFGYLFFKYRKKINLKRLYYIIIFLILGFTPYIYLPIRSATDGIFAFVIKTTSWESFWWTILRTAYDNTAPSSTLQLYINQVEEFLTLFVNDFSFMWVIVFFGLYSLWKKTEKFYFFIQAY